MSNTYIMLPLCFDLNSLPPTARGQHVILCILHEMVPRIRIAILGTSHVARTRRNQNSFLGIHSESNVEWTKYTIIGRCPGKMEHVQKQYLSI